ncbi:CHAD domain-containing protein [Yinghuangia soli]|uniref:CHAD domain-containing protein n=1 Tax=Yinghuangia soli TaxID=2908204 RepID=A0AA41PXX6_9ACTN|nr:CHAD domain-containing protein [Yinghuangia soli]MCF2526854.1 CHAD domain-containing protein [Yinghuangia soli]
MGRSERRGKSGAGADEEVAGDAAGEARLPHPRPDSDRLMDKRDGQAGKKPGDKPGDKAAAKPGRKADKKSGGTPGTESAAKSLRKGKGKSASESAAEPAPVPPPAPAPEPPPVRTAGDVLLDHLRGEAAAFLAQEPRVRESAEDSAHQMRVAARRMRSALRTCKPLLAPGPADALAMELRWAADSLAGERDNEVLLERLLAGIGQLPVRSGTPRARAALERRLRGGLTAGHTTALRALDSADFGLLAAQLAAPDLGLELTGKAGRAAADSVPALAAKTFGRLADGADALPLAAAGVAYAHPVPLSGEDDEAWHRVRILGKRARYAADMCVPEFGAPAKDLAKRMKAVTESLGTHQDAALAAEVARDLAVSPRIGGAAAFVLGELYVLQRFAVAEARYTFATLWPGLRDRLGEVSRWGG